MRPETPSPAASRLTTLLTDRRGFALEATLIVLVLISVLVGASVASYVMIQRSSSVDYRGTRVSYAAEAGADAVISQLASEMTDGISELGGPRGHHAALALRLHLRDADRHGHRLADSAHHHLRPLQRVDRTEPADRHRH